MKTIRKDFFIKRPAVPVALVTVAVTYISTYIGRLTVIFAALFLSAMIISLVFKDLKAFAAALIILVISVNLCLTYNKLNTVRAFAGKEVSGTFVVTADSVSSGGDTEFQIKSISGDLPKGCLLEPKYSGEETFTAGEIINADVALYDVDKSYRKSHYSEGIYAISRIESFEFKDDTNIFYKMLGSIRRYIKECYLKYAPGDAGALLIAITIGDKSYLSDGLAYSIRQIGVSHMVAVSGFHLAVIMGNLFSLFNRFVKNRYLRFLMSLLAVVFIAGVCGFTKSILRAGSMFIISAAAVLFDRESDSLSSLLLSIPAVFMISPFAIFSVGFNLSVIATFALVYISPLFCDTLYKILAVRSEAVKSLINIMFNSFFAALYTMPAIIKVFGTVSIVSIFANLFLNYLVTLALVFGAFALVLSPVGFISKILFSAAALFSKAMIFIISGFYELPVVSVNLGQTSYIISLVVILVLTALVYYYNNLIIRGSKA